MEKTSATDLTPQNTRRIEIVSNVGKIIPQKRSKELEKFRMLRLEKDSAYFYCLISILGALNFSGTST